MSAGLGSRGRVGLWQGRRGGQRRINISNDLVTDLHTKYQCLNMSNGLVEVDVC